jgi:hypothetical protein
VQAGGQDRHPVEALDPEQRAPVSSEARKS